ncbi:hypothetical protein QF028_002726 [Neobacillus sp. B4I6]
MSKLINESQVIPLLGVKIGLNKAVVLQNMYNS